MIVYSEGNENINSFTYMFTSRNRTFGKYPLTLRIYVIVLLISVVTFLCGVEKIKHSIKWLIGTDIESINNNASKMQRIRFISSSQGADSNMDRGNINYKNA